VNQVDPGRRAVWLARLVVGAVFLFNVNCALSFVGWPGRYAPAFELQGIPGEVMVRGMGILFLMWNATYPPVLIWPGRRGTLFAVILAQQIIGLAGETWMWLALPPGHDILRDTGARFILFDAAGLAGMVLAFYLLRRSGRQSPT